jgi:ribosomal protein S12 methylthiotransferase accessory factor
VRRVEAAGSTLYAVDVTSPDVRDLGLVVVKTIAPELCALDVPHAARFLGGRRLYEAPVQLGLRDTPLAESDVNPAPHPFP